MKKILFILIALAFFFSAHAQKTYHHGVFWGRLILSDTINNRFKWELYLQKRTQSAGSGNILQAPHFISIWPWLNYKLSQSTRLSFSPLGYFDSHVFYSRAEDIKPQGVKEYRITARLENEQKLSFFNYSNRYSLEYRMRDLAYNGDYQPNWRVRYQLKLEKPLFNVIAKDKPLSVFLSDEIFVQFGKAVRKNPNIFDQNRINVGASYELVKNVRLSTSYLNIIQQRISGVEIDDAHTIWIVLAFENLFSQFKRKS